MSRVPKLNHPWLVAVWPGMGHVALSAGYYLLAKLGMHELAEFTAAGLFDVDQTKSNKGVSCPHSDRAAAFISGKRRRASAIGMRPGGSHRQGDATLWAVLCLKTCSGMRQAFRFTRIAENLDGFRYDCSLLRQSKIFHKAERCRVSTRQLRSVARPDTSL
jgi:hypothetical protein